MDAQAYRNGHRAGTHGRGNGKDRANNERAAIEAELLWCDECGGDCPGFGGVYVPHEKGCSHE